MALYVIFVLLQLIIRGKDRRYYDLLQIPLSLIFIRFMNLFNDKITVAPDTFAGQLFLLFAAVTLTGIGAAMSVNMHIIPNPGDGIVAAIAEVAHKEMGGVKNIFDLVNIGITFCIGLLSGHFLLGIGIGTVLAVIGVGRVVAVFNFLCKKKMAVLAGLEA